MTVSTNLSFQSPLVIFTVSVGPDFRNPIVQTVISWNPSQMRLVRVVSPPGGVVGSGNVTWTNVEIQLDSSMDFILEMCRRGLNFPTIIATCRNMETGEEYEPQEGHVPGSFRICSATPFEGKASKTTGTKKAKRPSRKA